MNMSNAEVAGECHVGAAAVDAPLQHGDGDGARIFDRIDHLVEAHVAGAADLADVVAAAEVLAFGLQAQHQHRLVGVDGGHVLRQGGQVFRCEAVGLLRPAQRDRGDVVADREFGCHAPILRDGACRAERRAAPKLARIPSGDRPAYPAGRGADISSAP
jgi:hypothetical protein